MGRIPGTLGDSTRVFKRVWWRKCHILDITDTQFCLNGFDTQYRLFETVRHYWNLRWAGNDTKYSISPILSSAWKISIVSIDTIPCDTCHMTTCQKYVVAFARIVFPHCLKAFLKEVWVWLWSGELKYFVLTGTNNGLGESLPHGKHSLFRWLLSDRYSGRPCEDKRLEHCWPSYR